MEGGGGGGQKHFGAFGLLAWGLSRGRFPGSPPCGAAATLSAEAGVSPDCVEVALGHRATRILRAVGSGTRKVLQETQAVLCSLRFYRRKVFQGIPPL